MLSVEPASSGLRRKLPFVTDASDVNANPGELPVGEKSYQKITRGHLASNVEMKSLGDPEEGLQAQKDSFSLANVVPQMQRHHAPIWVELEDACMEAARRLGTTVGVISGPVYAPVRSPIGEWFRQVSRDQPFS